MLALINKLSREKISVSVEGEDLKLVFENESGTLEEDVINEIRKNKPALIQYLKKYGSQQAYEQIPVLAPAADYAISDGQRRLWILSQFPGTSRAYHMPVRIPLEGDYSPEYFEKAILQVIHRHEILRTVFRENENGEIRQLVQEAAFNLDFKDAGSWDETTVRRYLDEEADRPFDLANGPLLRAGLLKIRSGYYIFHFNMHHIISDGWSLELLKKEVLAFYRVFAEGTTYQPSPLRIQYKEYAAWQQMQLNTQKYQENRSYWQQQFSGTLPVLELPTAATRPAVLTHNGDTLSMKIGRPVTAALHQLCRKEGSTIFMALVAGLNALFYRYSGQEDIILGTPVAGRDHTDLEEQIGFYVNTLPLRIQFSGENSFRNLLQHVRQTTLSAYQHQLYPFDRLIEELDLKRDLSRSVLFDVMVILQSHRDKMRADIQIPGDVKEEGSSVVKMDLNFDFAESEDGIYLRLEFNKDVYDRQMMRQLLRHYNHILEAAANTPDTALCDLNYLPDTDRQQLLQLFNETAAIIPIEKTMVDLFREHAKKTGDAIAVISDDKTITFAELDKRSDSMAAYLLQKGLHAEMLVPVCLNRCVDMLVAILGVLKAGGAYVPVDPDYPADRVEYMLKDSGATIVLSNAVSASHIPEQFDVILLDSSWDEIAGVAYDVSGHAPAAQQLAYMIYTSGSTGKPKGVMIEHGNLLNFMYGMDRLLPLGEEDHLLAITSISFDISILELFWTLCRGIKITLHDNTRSLNDFNSYVKDSVAEMDFSLFYFSSLDNAGDAQKYDFLMRSVDFADKHGFTGVWLPERHFHEFGGIFPNPAVLGAALATITKNIEIRSGSVVLPLHDVIRVAEEWSMVDNLSHGRVSLSIASGWHVDDFVLLPGNYAGRQAVMYRQIEELKALWRGESIKRPNGNNKETTVRIFPRPLQKELPVWVTSGGNTETFISAGKIGANILTHLLGQDLSTLEKNIAAYKKALWENGHHPSRCKIAIMLHTFIGEDADNVKVTVKAPFKSYLRSNLSLFKNLAAGLDLDMNNLTADDTDLILEMAFERYWQTAALLGTKETCSKLVNTLYAAGVTEIACLVDFGVPADEVLESLSSLHELKEQYRHRAVKTTDGITAMQITPSYLNTLMEDAGSQLFLKTLQHIIVGGEGFPDELLRKLQVKTGAAIYNVYGPTETTIWSAGTRLSATQTLVTAGKPIANTSVYILDKHKNLCPAGVYGELFIGGLGLSRGYRNNAALTSEKFISNHFNQGERIYRTGDLARWSAEGNIEIAGRNDDQVKIRGYRIEPGEVEKVLLQSGLVSQAVVLARADGSGSNLLLAFIVGDGNIDKTQLSLFAKTQLPDYMVPSQFFVLDNLPMTANGKIDRKVLATMDLQTTDERFTAPRNEMETSLAGIWQKVLHRQQVSVTDDFWSQGGHSLRLMQLQNHYYRAFDVKLPLQELFRHTTIEAHAALIKDQGKASYNAIPVQETAADYPVSDGQRRLWVISHQEDIARSYNTPGRIELTGSYNAGLLEEAIRGLITRHEILRTVFYENQQGELRQVVQEKGNFSMDYMDLENSDRGAVNSYINQLSDVTFDLLNGPLVKAGLVKLSAERYILWFNLHHIISDGWSMDIIGREVMDRYAALQKNETIILPPLRIQYKDYAAWHLQQLQSATVHRNYWLKQLSGDIPALKLFASGTRPMRKTERGYSLALTLQSTDLKQLCSEENSTLYMGLLGLLNTLFYRYSGQEDILIGSPVAGREHVELENQIGFYINTIVLRTHISGKESFRNLLSDIRNTTLDAYEHQMYPFDRIVDELQLERDSSRAPLFDVMLTLQNQQHNPSGYTRNTTNELVNTSVKYDMLFNVEEHGEQLHIELKYNADIYEERAMRRLMQHLRQLLDKVLQQPDQPLETLDFLLPSERLLLSNGWNVNRHSFDRSKTVLQLFREQVVRTPDDVAIISGNEQLTYRQLDERSNQLANYLLAEGLQSEEPVVISARKSASLAPGILGILKAGGAFVPVDPSFPEDRIRYITTDTGSRFMISEETLVGTYPVSMPAVNIHPHALAYIIYTSGSTGQPKGVMISHASLSDHLLDAIPRAGLSSCRSFAIMASLAADAYHTIFFGSLLLGAELHLITDEILYNGMLLKQYLSDHRIDGIKIFPSLWNSYAGEDVFILPEKVLIFGGESFTQAVLQRLRNQSYQGRVFNHYGPTETTIGVLLHEVDLQHAYPVVPVGKPYSNTQVYIVDSTLQLCPVGVAGELLIGGEGVALGYLHQPAMEAEKFIANPFLAGERVYRTGDVGYWTEEGDIVYAGRTDDQVKVRGYRIELGEISQVMVTVAGITQAAVLLHENQENDKFLIAYYTGKKTTPEKLRAQLGQRLPEYMLPGIYIHMETLPLMANGKIDRRKLPSPESATNTEEKTYVAPRNEIETAVLESCQKVLKRPLAGGMADSFFESGGDSIKAILLATQLKQRGYTVKVGEILKYPQLEVLSRHVQPVAQVIITDNEPVQGDVILLPAQASFFERSYPDKHHYNMSVLLRSKEPVDGTILEKCLGFIGRHHDALRMVYLYENNKWRQFNRDVTAPSYTLEVHDLRNTPDELRALGEKGEQLQASVQLETGPLLKVALCRLTDGDRILLVVHHLVFDGVSWRILLDDLATLYEQFHKGEIPVLPAKTDTFRKWATLQHTYANSEALLSEIPYWQSIIDTDVLHLPKDIEAAKMVHAGKSNAANFTLDAAITETLLTGIHHVYNTDVKDVLLAALGLSIQETFGNSHVLLRQEGHGREDLIRDVNIDRTIGWFTTLYPLLLDTSGTTGKTDYLIKVKEQLRAIPNKGMGYGMLHYLRTDSAISKDILGEADITFNYLGEFSSIGEVTDKGSLFFYSSEYKGYEVSAVYEPETPVTITVAIMNSCLHISIRYVTGSFLHSTISRLLKSYSDQLTSLISALEQEKGTYVTPGDLTYKGLGLAELASLNTNGDVEDVYELSPLQEGIYYFWLSDPGSSSYVNQVSYHVSGKLDIAILKESYAYLCRRHAIMRTSFTHHFGEIHLQVVTKNPAVGFSYERADSDEFVRNRKEADIRKGFDLHTGSQMRLTVLEQEHQQYVFIWSYHHILMDGWCGGMLIREFYVIYQSLLSGVQPKLNKLHKYAAYIDWLSHLDVALSRSYWQSYLADYDQLSAVPFKKQSVTDGQTVISKERFELDEVTVAAIRSTCRELGITENTFMQACWSWLLGRYNNTSDVVFGAVVSGRPGELEGVENMVGLFINTIPVRVKYDKDLTVRELMQDIQETAIVSLPHHYMRLSEIQSASTLRNELFDHIFVYENFPVQEMISSGDNGLDTLQLTASETTVASGYDFTLQIAPVRDHLRITFMYRETIYQKEQVATIGVHFRNVVQAFSTAVDQPLSAVDFMSVAEQQSLFCQHTVVYPADKNIITLFEEQVLLTPDAPALQFEGKQLTCRELNEAANRLGHYLVEKGVQPGSLVPLCIDRSLDTIIGILGILKAGAAYVPVDPSYPEERIRFILNDVRASVVVTNTEYAARLGETAVVCIDKMLQSQPVDNLTVHISPESPLYVIYTSGSTGIPKGVLISHRNVTDYVYGLQQSLHTADCQSFALVSGIYTDLGNTVLYTALLQGGCLHLFSKDMVNNAVGICDYFAEHKIDCLKIVPSHWKALSHGEQLLLPARLLIFGGEALHADVVRRIQLSGSNCTIVNHYGPTETTIGKLLHVVTDGYGETIPIGKPFSNSYVYILDKQRRPCAAGVPGELYIGGAGISSGYLNNDMLTAQRFIRDPFREDGTLYQTGDKVRYLPDGNILFMGRMDNQVKVRGYRIELEEIETMLQKAPGVKQGVVMLIADGTGEQQLVAFVSGVEEKESVTTYLRTQLPEYMLPAQMVLLTSLPLASNGKINRRELAAMDLSGVSLEKVYVAPRNETEEVLAKMWQDILGLSSPVSITANFFELGGHSIKVIKLLARISKEFGVVLSIQTMFKEATVEYLSKQVLQQQWLKAGIGTEESDKEFDVIEI
ncbi:amino acid adenylation domain-containing protein [Chitinophaga oryziterrae]|uniref:Amino acid adenylation domain-containing protein n=1 Tax=Chitinophaga oryziterrae TaxID=1031224 RepID=A0A6N8JBB8_9BACT|nr:non-ribosomal peptide synthetase [Chitinophaga oryziterrae]MVT42254.1 amino acid adenylation domain-containing protein [Chitinophaga oryziterrae]